MLEPPGPWLLLPWLCSLRQQSHSQTPGGFGLTSADRPGKSPRQKPSEMSEGSAVWPRIPSWCSKLRGSPYPTASAWGLQNISPITGLSPLLFTSFGLESTFSLKGSNKWMG